MVGQAFSANLETSTTTKNRTRPALIKERYIHMNEKVSFEVSSEKIEAVHIIPDRTHNIINLSDTENLVTLMWANEQLDPNHPDTFFEPV